MSWLSKMRKTILPSTDQNDKLTSITFEYCTRQRCAKSWRSHYYTLSFAKSKNIEAATCYTFSHSVYLGVTFEDSQ